MTESEAYKFIGQSVIESGRVLKKLQSIKSEAERIGEIGEYYANLDNCVKEIEACRVAIQAKNETARVQIRERELERIRRESKKKAKENQKIIVSIAVEARKHGMSYGQYVAFHNL